MLSMSPMKNLVVDVIGLEVFGLKETKVELPLVIDIHGFPRLVIDMA